MEIEELINKYRWYIFDYVVLPNLDNKNIEVLSLNIGILKPDGNVWFNYIVRQHWINYSDTRNGGFNIKITP